MKPFTPYIKRFLLSALSALLFVGVINETAHLIQRSKTDRPPETVELLIPNGTAEQVAAGETPPAIPEELTFVIGDKLLVTNHDDVPHELGPLFIPAGTSASLNMDDANKYTLGCTFTPSKYLDFNVNPRTTSRSRLTAFALTGPPTAMFFFVYSLLVFPMKKTETTA
jgi:hypothetical protein